MKYMIFAFAWLALAPWPLFWLWQFVPKEYTIPAAISTIWIYGMGIVIAYYKDISGK